LGYAALAPSHTRVGVNASIHQRPGQAVGQGRRWPPLRHAARTVGGLTYRDDTW